MEICEEWNGHPARLVGNNALILRESDPSLEEQVVLAKMDGTYVTWRMRRDERASYFGNYYGIRLPDAVSDYESRVQHLWAIHWREAEGL